MLSRILFSLMAMAFTNTSYAQVKLTLKNLDSNGSFSKQDYLTVSSKSSSGTCRIYDLDRGRDCIFYFDANDEVKVSPTVSNGKMFLYQIKDSDSGDVLCKYDGNPCTFPLSKDRRVDVYLWPNLVAFSSYYWPGYSIMITCDGGVGPSQGQYQFNFSGNNPPTTTNYPNCAPLSEVVVDILAPSGDRTITKGILTLGGVQAYETKSYVCSGWYNGRCIGWKAR